MSENIQSIANGTYTIGSTNELTFQAGPGITIDSPSAGTVRIGNDETVLWSGTGTSGDYALSESYKNFEKIGITHGCTYSHSDRGLAPDTIFDVDSFILYNCGQIITTDMTRNSIDFNETTGDKVFYESYVQFSAVNDTKLHFNPARVLFYTLPVSNGTVTGHWARENSRRYFKIYGINRISGGNA